MEQPDRDYSGGTVKAKWEGLGLSTLYELCDALPEKTYAARVARFAYYGDEGGGQPSSPSTLKHLQRLERY